MVNGQFAALVNFNIGSHIIKRSVRKVFYDVYFFSIVEAFHSAMYTLMSWLNEVPLRTKYKMFSNKPCEPGVNIIHN